MVNAECTLPSMREEPVNQFQFSSDRYFLSVQTSSGYHQGSNKDVVLEGLDVFVFKTRIES